MPKLLAAVASPSHHKLHVYPQQEAGCFSGKELHHHCIYKGHMPRAYRVFACIGQSWAEAKFRRLSPARSSYRNYVRRHHQVGAAGTRIIIEGFESKHEFSEGRGKSPRKRRRLQQENGQPPASKTIGITHQIGLNQQATKVAGNLSVVEYKPDDEPQPADTDTQSQSSLTSGSQKPLSALKFKIVTKWNSLKRMGKFGLLSYLSVGNFLSVTLLIATWAVFGKTHGVSPLTPGYWRKYLGSYVLAKASIGMVLKAPQLALGISLTPKFEQLVEFVADRFSFSTGIAYGLIVLSVNFIGALSYLALGICIASTCAGVPLFAAV